MRMCDLVQTVTDGVFEEHCFVVVFDVMELEVLQSFAVWKRDNSLLK